MKQIPYTQAIKKINHLWEHHTPFLFAINYKQTMAYVQAINEISPQECLFNMGTWCNDKEISPSPLPSPMMWHPCPMPAHMYHTGFKFCHDNIHLGNSFLLNLTAQTPVNTNLTLHDIYTHAQARFKLLMKNEWVCFSPEPFVSIREGKISSFPMKGTIDAQDENSLQNLLNNRKEAAEHATITDLIRNDLSRIATNVHVARYRYGEKLETNNGPIWQTSSQISGTLCNHYQKQIGFLLDKLLPAGSITGAPKRKTMEIIDHAEDFDRGYYTGVMGVGDGYNLDSAVMIRFAERHEPGSLIFKTGGGITSQSNWEDEYKEMIQKVYVPIY